MKRLVTVTTLLAFIVCLMPLTALASHSHAQSKSIRVLKKSGPHQISGRKGKNFVTFYLKITGLVMDPHIGKRNVAGHGHVQMYLSKIPSDSYRKKDLKGIVSYAPVSKVGKSKYAVSIEFDSAWIKLHKGHRHLKIGLAKNNYVMYPVKAASFALNVK